MEKKITKIPATIGKYTSKPINSNVKLKVAGYARISTDHEDQITSYEAQVDYYTNYIKSREDWEFVGIYTDEGISATNTKKRIGFNKMIADALSGKINLIITKSLSRFARNTVDSLSTIRKLKENGVECYFEKENIWTFDGRGELMITILSSLSQEESRSISENVTWGCRKRMADGKVSFSYSHFLGYDKTKDGEIVINEEQAKTVRYTYRLFLEGFTPYSIAKKLTEEGYLTPAGKTVWRGSTVRSILTNEKYKGDALLQKTFTVDFLNKKSKINNGEVQQYYVEDSHPAIISKEVFDMVQTEMSRRLKTKKRYSGTDRFSGKIICGECGSFYGAKVWHSNDKYRRVIYRCNDKYKCKCKTPHLDEKAIEQIFINAINKLLKNKDEVIKNLNLAVAEICSETALREEEEKLREKIDVIVRSINNCIAENASTVLNQSEYQKRYDGMVEKYNVLMEKLEMVIQKLSIRQNRKDTITQFIVTLEKQEQVVTEFDGALWGSLVDYIKVYDKENIKVIFRDGTEI